MVHTCGSSTNTPTGSKDSDSFGAPTSWKAGFGLVMLGWGLLYFAVPAKAKPVVADLMAADLVLTISERRRHGSIRREP